MQKISIFWYFHPYTEFPKWVGMRFLVFHTWIVRTSSKRRVSGTNMGPVFIFVPDHLNTDHYLTSSSSIDGKFHVLHRYKVEIGKK